jgi:hypothetical protein
MQWAGKSLLHVYVRDIIDCHPSSNEGGNSQVNLLLIPLTKGNKSPDIFKLASQCYVVFKVEAYRTRNGLTQCLACQKFGSVLN